MTAGGSEKRGSSGRGLEWGSGGYKGDGAGTVAKGEVSAVGYGGEEASDAFLFSFNCLSASI